MEQRFLNLPFDEEAEVNISEGWLYSDEEKAVHGLEAHLGIDFAAPRGTPVYAAAGGYAIASFHSHQTEREYQSKRVGYALGRFVQIYHPSRRIFTLYAHLDRVEQAIPFIQPAIRGEAFYPTVVNKPLKETLKHAVRVRRGQLIGWVGDSGLTWGYRETPHRRRDSARQPSWDEPHLHFEVFKRNRGKKSERFDPYGIYGPAARYNIASAGVLWRLDQNGQPQRVRI